MSKGVSNKLADKIKSAVYASQIRLVHKLQGKYVKRDGVVFYIKSVNWSTGKMVVSDTKTALNITTAFQIKSFLSKKVEEVEVEKVKTPFNFSGDKSIYAEGK